MHDETSKSSSDQAEEDNEGDIPSNTGTSPVYGDNKINEGASFSLSGHVYPNPPVF
jgi:hypothetical protein